MGSSFYTKPASDSAGRPVYWLNFEGPGMAPDMSRRETPMQASCRPLPKGVNNVLDDLNSPGTYD